MNQTSYKRFILEAFNIIFLRMYEGSSHTSSVSKFNKNYYFSWPYYKKWPKFENLILFNYTFNTGWLRKSYLIIYFVNKMILLYHSMKWFNFTTNQIHRINVVKLDESLK